VSIVNLVMSQLITFVLLGLVVAMVMKIFQVSTDLSEIKDILSEIRRNTAEAVRPVLAPPPLASPEALMRAVYGESQGAPEYQESALEPPEA
jgi:hypothetical protein